MMLIMRIRKKDLFTCYDILYHSCSVLEFNILNPRMYLFLSVYYSISTLFG